MYIMSAKTNRRKCAGGLLFFSLAFSCHGSCEKGKKTDKQVYICRLELMLGHRADTVVLNQVLQIQNAKRSPFYLPSL